MTDEEFMDQSHAWRETEIDRVRRRKGREPTAAELRVITDRQLRHNRDLTVALARIAMQRRKQA